MKSRIHSNLLLLFTTITPQATFSLAPAGQIHEVKTSSIVAAILDTLSDPNLTLGEALATYQAGKAVGHIAKSASVIGRGTASHAVQERQKAVLALESASKYQKSWNPLYNFRIKKPRNILFAFAAVYTGARLLEEKVFRPAYLGVFARLK